MNDIYDYVGQIIAFESGELEEEEVFELFRYLIKTGIIDKLQGSYQRAAYQLQRQGVI